MPLPKKKSEKEKNYLKKIYLWHGIPKIGKTTTAAAFGDDEEHKILFFATEPGHKFQEVYKWKREDGKDPHTWNDWLNCVKEIAKDDGGFDCLAIDTIDNLWKWCSNYVLKRKDIEHESDEGYGKGYHAVAKEFEKPLLWLLQNGYGMILLSHSGVSSKKIGPREVTYTDSTLPNTAKKLIHPLCDYIFYFATNDNGDRVIVTKGDENFNAGDRSGKLPAMIPMDANKLKEALQL